MIIAVLLIAILVLIVIYKLYYYPNTNSDTITDMYLINLDRRPDRLRVTMKNLNLYGYDNVKRYSAVDSSIFTAKQIDSLTDPASRESIYKNYRTDHEQLSKGAIGCYLSHLNLWKDMVDKNKKNIVVFEDDTNPTINKSEIESYIKNVPNDWDIIMFGAFYRNGWKINDDIYKIQRFFGMHAYIIKNTKNVKRMIDNSLPIKKQIDWYLTDMSSENKLNIYGIMGNPMWLQNEKVNSTDIQIPLI